MQNIGDPDSPLNWDIDTASIPWGTWSFSPQSGEGLTPEDGPLIVQVSVIAPDEKNKEFTGFITVQNSDDPADFEVVQVYLKTLKPSPPTFLQRWPLLQQILQNILRWQLFLEDLTFK